MKQKISTGKKSTPTPPKATARYFKIIRLVFQSFDVHLSLIYKKRPEQKANVAK